MIFRIFSFVGKRWQQLEIIVLHTIIYEWNVVYIWTLNFALKSNNFLTKPHVQQLKFVFQSLNIFLCVS